MMRALFKRVFDIQVCNKSSEIRQKFLDYFASKVTRWSLPVRWCRTKIDAVVHHAGLNQFKMCSSASTSDLRRAASSQKCVRAGASITIWRTSLYARITLLRDARQLQLWRLLQA